MALMYQSKEGVGWRGEGKGGGRKDTWCRQSRTIPGYIKESSPRKCDGRDSGVCDSERARAYMWSHEGPA